jgi:curved DNA-binding protein CbpA
MMKTLYDLLGALPHDDAEGLRIAFRRAVKGAHPDVRPGDPDAALKFREIVRASEILYDGEQRAVYDDLLKLARLEQKSASKHPLAAARHKIISVLIALGGASGVIAGGYLLFMYMSAASVASVINSHTAGVSPTQCERPSIASEPMMLAAAMPSTNAEGVRASNVGEASELAASAPRSQPEAVSASGRDLKSRISDLDEALHLGTKPLPAYVDPGVVFYRIAASDRVFPDVTLAHRIEKAGRSKSAPTKTRKPLIGPAAIATSATPLSRRTAAQDLSRNEGTGSAVMLR